MILSGWDIPQSASQNSLDFSKIFVKFVCIWIKEAWEKDKMSWFFLKWKRVEVVFSSHTVELNWDEEGKKG